MYLGPPNVECLHARSTADAYRSLSDQFHSTAPDKEGYRGPVIIFVRNDVSSLCSAICLLRLFSKDAVYTNLQPFTDATEYFLILNHLARRVVSQGEHVAQMGRASNSETTDNSDREAALPVASGEEAHAEGLHSKQKNFETDSLAGIDGEEKFPVRMDSPPGYSAY